MSGPNKSIAELDRMGREAAAEARRRNDITNHGHWPRMGSYTGRDNIIKVPFAAVALVVISLVGGITGHVVGGAFGMWVGMVVGAVLVVSMAAMLGRVRG